MQIGRMGFARVERDDDALMLEVDFHILHSGNALFSTGRSLRTHSSQSSPSVAISIVSRNVLVAALRKKWIGRIGISRSCGVHGIDLLFI